MVFSGHRQRSKIRRNDLIDLMLDAVEDGKKGMDEIILLGNSLIFLIAGYDSTGLTISYAFWHLVREIQWTFTSTTRESSEMLPQQHRV